MAVTRLVITQRILRHFNQQDEALAMLPVPMSFTADGADTTHLDDSKLGRSSTSDGNRFDKRAIEVVTDDEGVPGDPPANSAGPAIGEISVVADAGFDSSDTLTIAPALSTLPKSGDSYLIYALGLSPTAVKQYINDALRLTHGPHIWFPSLVPDAEFEANDTAQWFDIGSPGTPAAFATTAGNSLFGEGQIAVVTDGASQGVSSGAFEVTENENMLVMVTIMGTNKEVVVAFRRSTATAADIETVTLAGGQEAFTEVLFQATVTSGTTNAVLRFIATDSGTTFTISPPVIVQRQGWGAYPAPSWLTAPKAQLVQARTWLQGRASTTANTFVALTAPIGGVVAVAPGWRSDNWLTPNYIMVEARSRPTYFVVKRAYDELTSLTSTTNCDEDYVTYSAIARIYRDRGEQGSAREWGLRAAEIARAKGYGKDGAKIVENPLVRV